MSTIFKTECSQLLVLSSINLSSQADRFLVEKQEFFILQLGNDKGKFLIRIFFHTSINNRINRFKKVKSCNGS